MNNAPIDLSSVHWENGMTLSDEHFLRQERYFESSILWLLHYTSASFGLIGSGPRLGEGQVRPTVFDPEINVVSDSKSCTISLSSCRGITLGGAIVDFAGEGPELNADPSQIAGDECVYVVALPHEKVAQEIDSRDFDGQRQAERRQRYDLTLYPSQDQQPWSLAVARLIKSNGTVMRDPNYIPPCAFLSGHSGLIVAAENITLRLQALAGRFTELHRAMRDTLPLAQRAGIMAELGLDEITFAGRMVVAIEECLYETGEAVQPPHRFFGQFRRLLQMAYVFVSLSPRVRDHFRELLEKLQTNYLEPLNDHVDRLMSNRQQRLNADLGLELRLVEAALKELEHVEEGMEGRYIDFRVNQSLASIDHFFDGDILYRLVKAQQAGQTSAGEVSTSFRSLGLSGERVNYRIVLAGDPQVSLYNEVSIEISINDVGYRGSGQRLSSVAHKGQFNFDFDFRAPQGQPISDLTVRYASQFTFRTIMLFEEIRLGVAQPEVESPRPIRPEQPSPPIKPGRFDSRAASVTPRQQGGRTSAFDMGGKRPAAPSGDRPASSPPPRRRFDE